jgi:adenine deaminase
MRLPPRLRLAADERRALVAVAAGGAPADLVITGGRVLNVFTGELSRADIGIVAGRIAWVGEAPAGAGARQAREVGGRTIVPGLIDPHCHVDLMCTPSAFAAAAVRRGTTTIVADTYGLARWLDDEQLCSVLRALGRAPMKMLWGIRASLAAGGAEDLPGHSSERLSGLLRWPAVAGAGEVTAWPALLAGDARLERFVTEVLDQGLNVDAHAPGASSRTLGRLAAAGLSSDHEAIDGGELLTRVELGFWTMVRHSSLRPDGVTLGHAIATRPIPTERLMLTADGVMPKDLLGGHVDRVVRAVIEGGVAPIAAVRMATLHPAVYLGLDAHLGSIAPGRCADLLIVEDLERFQPEQVMCDGRFVDGGEELDDGIDWSAMRLPMSPARLDAGTLVEVCRQGPQLHLDGITARPADGAGTAERIYVALVARDGRSIVGTTIDTLDTRAVASSLTGSADALLMGRDPEAMIECYRCLVQMGGGLACPGDALAMPVLGSLSEEPVEVFSERLARFVEIAGVPDAPIPFSSRSSFLTLPALPGVCLTTEGIIEVRSGARLTEPRALERA